MTDFNFGLLSDTFLHYASEGQAGVVERLADVHGKKITDNYGEEL